MDQEGYVTLAFEYIVDISYGQRMVKGDFRLREELEQKSIKGNLLAQEQWVSPGNKTGMGPNGRYR